MKKNLIQIEHRLSALMLVFFLGVTCAMAQITVSGTVTDEKSEPLIGVSVLEKGTTNGVVTDLDGNFKLKAHNGAKLTFSYVGYNTVEIAAKEGRVSIKLKEDSKALDEVVVIGYGVQKKSSVTGAISSVKAEDMQNRTFTQAEQALQGKTAGVQLLGSAAPGSSPTIRIRGFSSNRSSNPLFVVDGLRTSSIANIDPNDIESMEVLKDAASAAIYGAEAGNGVVLITTKKAKKGIQKITYDFQLSSQKIGNIPDVLNAQEYINWMTEGGYISKEKINKYWDGTTDTNWADVSFENSLMQRHNFSFQGANDHGSLYASLGYVKDDGPIVGNFDTYERVTGIINADYKVADWIKFTTNNQIGRFNVHSVNDGAISGFGNMGSVMMAAIQLDPLTPVTYAADKLPDTMQAMVDAGRLLVKNGNGDYYSLSPFAESNNVNPYIIRDAAINRMNGVNVQGSTYIDLTPIKGLTITSRLGYRFNFYNNYSYSQPHVVNTDTYYDYATVNASSNTIAYWQWENFANYVKTFAGKHNLSAMIGTSYSENTTFGVDGGITGSSSTLGITKNDPLYAYFNYATGTAAKSLTGGEKLRNTKLSYFGRVGYDYMGTYFFQGSLRADAADTSILPTNKRWGYFPAVSLGWVVSNEKFLKDVKPITYLKVRASWGQNGSVAGLSDYMYAATIASTIKYSYSTSDASVNYNIGSIPSSTGNYNLKWETSEQQDYGIDLRMLNDRLSFTADYFIKKTKDLIVTGITPSLVVGNTVSPMNAGNVENKGLELELGWRDHIGDFRYGIKGNIATLKNNVTYIDPTLTRIAGGSAGQGTVCYFEKGHPIWYFRGYKYTGVDPQTGNPKFADLDGDGTIGDNDKTEIGSAVPDFTYGITIDAQYKGFDLIIFGSGSQGNDVFYGINRATRLQANMLKKFYDGRWTAVGQNSKYVRAGADDIDKYNLSSAMVFDGSYFKIKQIQLGYTLPSKLMKKVHLSSLRIYASLDDYFTITKYPGFDPEVTGTGSSLGIDTGYYAPTKKIVFGLNLGF
jgi:TonB-linked SusC/RagA family outer membrane protein